MKVAKSCSQCRIAKRRCSAGPLSEPRCQQCLTRDQCCSWITDRSTRRPKPLLPDLSCGDASLSRRQVVSIDDNTRDELVELYLKLIHDKPHTLFHPTVLKIRVQNGSLAKATLYCILALAARFSISQDIREQTDDFFHLAKDHVKLSIDNVCLDILHAAILIGNLCGADGDASGESLFFGIAFRMAQILRLPKPTQGDDTITVETKLRTWWSLYMIDQWSSAGLNIPRQIPDGSQHRHPISELKFQELLPGEVVDDCLLVKPALWGYMVTLARIFGHIQHLHQRLADGTSDDSSTELATYQLESELECFLRDLPTEVRFNIDNLRTHAALGLGPAFVALHLGYHHYSTLLYFPYLGTQLSRVTDHEAFAVRCRHHAAAFSELLKSSNEMEGCEVLYFIVAHMAVTSSSVLLHTLLFGQEDELPDTRRRLYYNFQVLLKLKSFWPGVDLMMERLFTFQKVCMLSMDRIYTVDKWIVKFLLQHALPIDKDIGPPATSQLAERGKYASDALSMLRSN
ncbi:hypothetical protein BDV25DRAFT_172224 [Aspergillus avenaceus]|uniref:Zn(2)-C6 fungal-type domain-containing protein n=1 Tax=Aspergillus avenaceus TaxID=36643 RepID=A0A5N6TW94_ASPAV|nr:hypothetical protein BDV25DRAFT_172224 [Aspergillus avenaceus]